MTRPSPDGAQLGYRTAWKRPIVRRLWGASAISTVGDYVGLGALLFVATDQTGLALGAAAVLAAGIVPSVLTGAVAGSWLDRYPRGPTLAVLQLLGALVVCLPLLHTSVPVVLVTAALLAAIRVATIAVRSATIAAGVPDEHRGPLVALLSTTEQAGQVLGFLTGGVLYVVLGLQAALVLDAVTFVAAAVILGQIRVRNVQRATTPRAPVTAGMTDIVRHPVLRLLAGLVAITGAVSSLPETLAPQVTLGHDAWRPFVLAAAPLGQAVTTAVIGRTRAIHRPSAQLVHFVSLALALGLASFARTPATAAAAYLLVGAGIAWIVGPQLMFLRLAPKARMAHVTGTMVAILALSDGLGSLAFAAIADGYGHDATFRAAAGLLVLVAAIAWRIKEATPEVIALDEDELPANAPAGAGTGFTTSTG